MQLHETISRQEYLALFRIHVRTAKQFVSNDDIRNNIEEGKCPFDGLKSHFTGDDTFRQMRRYYLYRQNDESLRKEMIDEVCGGC